MSRDDSNGDSVPDGASSTALGSAAFPAFARIFAVAIIVLLALAAARASDQLRHASWTTGSLLLLAGAWFSIAWLGYWIVNSRIRLQGDVLTQTWIWPKRTHVRDVAQLKLVHVPLLSWIVAPRLLVRQRSGAVLWFQSADASVLTAFCAQVARWQMAPKS